MSKFLSSKKFVTILTLLGLYLLASGSSWMVFSTIRGGDNVGEETINGGDLDGTRSRINLDLPKTEECPMNGAMFTSPEKSIWESRRPITAIIENSLDSRPQSGLSNADIIMKQ